MNDVILVDENDHEIGTMEKHEAHRQGKLHRAFSVFIFHPDGRMLLQRRALDKYHSAGLWSNACCSHPRPGEELLNAAHRRLREEMGFDAELKEVHAFMYRAEFDNGMTEHEYDHVLIGKCDALPKPNPKEAADWIWISVPELQAAIRKHPDRYTYWLKAVLDDVLRLV